MPGYEPCLGEPSCWPPDGEVTPDGRQYKDDGHHNPACPHAVQSADPEAHRG